MLAHRLLPLIGLTCATSSLAAAQSFIPLTPTQCPQSSSNLFTTGGQYIGPDGNLNPNNGVLQNSWSMLMRWQGNMLNPVAYDPSQYTGLLTATPHTSYQRGYQPESAVAVTPVTQLQCFDAGMILNSWQAPHVAVEGGGWNDMYGYAWGPSARPYAFQTLGTLGSWKPADLVLQGSIAVPDFVAYVVHPDGSWTIPPDPTTAGTGQLELFAYLEDAAHPTLHPIAMLTGVYIQGWAGCDDPQNDRHHGTLGRDYPNGVWFSASGTCSTDTQTADAVTAQTTGATFGDLRFYRAHFTPDNWRALITRINRYQCTAGVDHSCACESTHDCPATGYSMNPADYRLQYMGVIAETDLIGDSGAGTDIPNRQVGMSAHMKNVAAFHYTTP
jgi:hypothetical protein